MPADVKTELSPGLARFAREGTPDESPGAGGLSLTRLKTVLTPARLAARASLVVLSILLERNAYAGGFDIPDNGAQALGRGGAFVAKADDGSAIYWNPAGLARQRGTRLYGGASLFLGSYAFRRSGLFPDSPNDTATAPWGGRPFPQVSNSGGPFFTPFIALSTDFAFFDRLSVAIAAFGPPVVGNRTFPISTSDKPASSRYDFIQSQSSMVFPTASLAYRVTPWLDLGFSGHLVLAKFDQTSVSSVDTGQCKNVEYEPCDSRGDFVASATSFGGTVGALLRPRSDVSVGVALRMPVTLEAQGTFVPQIPKIASELAPGQASFLTRLPLVVRAGARYVSMDDDFEVYDIELDATFEAWNAAQGDGPHLRIPSLGALKNIDVLVAHGYADTFSIRAGGAYNFALFKGVVSTRGGAFFDSSATSPAYTRLDVDTLAKVAGTLGLGYKAGGLAFDVGYAAVASVSRTVAIGEGKVRPINLANAGLPIGSDGTPYPAVNEGVYKGFTHIVSVGLSVTFDELFGAPRPFYFGNSYERGYVEPGSSSSTNARDDAKGPRTTGEPVVKKQERRQDSEW